VAGLFVDPAAARSAITELSATGLSEEQIAIAALDSDAQGELVDRTEVQPLSRNSVVTGTFGGNLVEGMARLLGGGRGAANIVYTSLVRMGFSEDAARYYEQGFEQGRVVVAVEGSIFADQAAEILARHGADLGPTSNAAPFAASRTEPLSSGSLPPSTGPAGLNRSEL
jgi:hypothetical protein